MEKSLHRKIIIDSILVAVIALFGRALGLKFPDEGLITTCYLMLGFSFISILTSYAIKFQEKKWIRKTARYSVFLLPFLFMAFVTVDHFSNNETAIIIPSVILFLFIFISMVHIFLYTDEKVHTANIVFMALLILGFFFKRQHWPLAGWIMTFGSALLCVGNFMYGIRCIFLAEKISYLKNVSFLGCCILSIAFLGQLFKINHWPGAGVLVIIGFAALIVGTMFILLTLHSSGFIDWQPFHKKILMRILVPWVFIFILYISRYMVPELNILIWSPNTDKKVAPYGFKMSDYAIENKNGLNPK